MLIKHISPNIRYCNAKKKVLLNELIIFSIIVAVFIFSHCKNDMHLIVIKTNNVTKNRLHAKWDLLLYYFDVGQ